MSHFQRFARCGGFTGGLRRTCFLWPGRRTAGFFRKRRPGGSSWSRSGVRLTVCLSGPRGGFWLRLWFRLWLRFWFRPGSRLRRWFRPGRSFRFWPGSRSRLRLPLVKLHTGYVSFNSDVVFRLEQVQQNKDEKYGKVSRQRKYNEPEHINCITFNCNICGIVSSKSACRGLRYKPHVIHSRLLQRIQHFGHDFVGNYSVRLQHDIHICISLVEGGHLFR